MQFIVCHLYLSNLRYKNVYQWGVSYKSLRKANESVSRSKLWVSVALGALWSKTVHLSQINFKKKVLTENV